MKRTTVATIVGAIVLLSWPMSAQQPTPGRQSPGAGGASAPYFPERFDWQHKRPDEVGMNAALVAQAVQAATASEMRTPRDLTIAQATSFGRDEPFDAIIGPM